MTNQKLNSKTFEFIYPALIAIGVAVLVIGALKFSSLAMAAGLVFLLPASWLIARFHLHHYLLMGLAFILPFSVEYALTDSVKMFIPGEPLLALALFALGWEVLKRPTLFQDLFSGESRWAIPLLVSFAISMAFSSMLWVSVKFSMINLSYMLVFYFWQKLLFKDRPGLFPKLLLLFSLSQAVVLVFSIYQFSLFNWNTVTVKGIFRPFYKDHTIFGATCALLFIFWLVSAAKTTASKLKLLYSALGLFFLLGVFISFSRAAFLSLLFSVFIWMALQIRVRVKHLALGGLMGILLIGLYQRQLVEMLYSNKQLSHDARASYMERIESSTNISTDLSNLERLNRWYAGIQMAAERPLAGFGPGTYQFKYIPYQNPRLMNRLTVQNHWHVPENSGGTAHSEYILALSEMGLFGLMALLLLIGRWCWIAFEKIKVHPQRINIMIAFTVISTYLFHGAFNNFLNTDKFAFLFWGFAAWMAANYERKTNHPKSYGLEILH